HLDLHSFPTRRSSDLVRASRSAGKAAFLDLSDGSAKIQIYRKRDVIGEAGFGLYELLDLGDWIGVEGTIFRTRAGELSIKARRLDRKSTRLNSSHVEI